MARYKTKTGACTSCGAEVGTERGRGTEWANVSGRYLRDLDDFVELCILCHRERDRLSRRAKSLVGGAASGPTGAGQRGTPSNE